MPRNPSYRIIGSRVERDFEDEPVAAPIPPQRPRPQAIPQPPTSRRDLPTDDEILAAFNEAYGGTATSERFAPKTESRLEVMERAARAARNPFGIENETAAAFLDPVNALGFGVGGRVAFKGLKAAAALPMVGRVAERAKTWAQKPLSDVLSRTKPPAPPRAPKPEGFVPRSREIVPIAQPRSAAIRQAELPPEFLAEEELGAANIYRQGRQAAEQAQTRGVSEAAEHRYLARRSVDAAKARAVPAPPAPKKLGKYERTVRALAQEGLEETPGIGNPLMRELGEQLAIEEGPRDLVSRYNVARRLGLSRVLAGLESLR